MANISAAVKKKSGPKHTRKELMKKNPIPWLVILIITAIGGGLFVYPNANDWLRKTSEIEQMEKDIPMLIQKNQDLSNEKDSLKESFENKARSYKRVSDQRFPEVIDNAKIAQIMEIYSILMQINYRSNKIELNTLNLSAPRNVDGAPYAETLMTINLSIDREMLQEFFAYIQTGEISNELENEVLRKGGGETASIEFLKLNKLPVANITTVVLNEERNIEEDARKEDVYNAQIQVSFFSKPI